MGEGEEEGVWGGDRRLWMGERRKVFGWERGVKVCEWERGGRLVVRRKATYF